MSHGAGTHAGQSMKMIGREGDFEDDDDVDDKQLSNVRKNPTYRNSTK